ncbi:hypothetical protein GCM10025868_17160 [Angustibacter aerolatus]|uniref:Uncharacterized protein n=1 Tax=Angustibacter aerolatus TaxID=1162965 RepID=A0ABQ6JI68_9ACTN|nr:hypothetical protein GCM10025868_17160 [Angustibacter aerolatus]
MGAARAGARQRVPGQGLRALAAVGEHEVLDRVDALADDPDPRVAVAAERTAPAAPPARPPVTG